MKLCGQFAILCFIKIPDSHGCEIEFSPTKEWRSGDKSGADPDEDEGEEGGEWCGERELTVLGYHHEPIIRSL